MTDVWLRSIRDAIVGGSFLIAAAVVGSSMPSASSITESDFTVLFGFQKVRAGLLILPPAAACLSMFFLGRSLLSPWVWTAKNRGIAAAERMRKGVS